MNSCKRVIARLDVKGKKLIKGIRFEGLRVIGDACDYAKQYANNGIDEIFYSDAVASLYGRNSLIEVLRETSKEVFVPITVGGAIRTVDDGRKLLSAGADKLALNTAVVRDPNLINKLSERFGKQCVVVSIQACKSFNKSGWDVMIESGRERSSKDLFEWIKEVQERGAGEILITSVDKDGTGLGHDNNLLEKVIDLINVPLVFGGGIGDINHLRSMFINHKNLSGVSIGFSLHHKKLKISNIKQELKKQNLPIRTFFTSKHISFIKENVTVGIIDYGMGNLQSLKNAFEILGKKCELINNIDDLQYKSSSNLLILPGVGAFPEGMKQLYRLELIDKIKNYSKKGGCLIGICLGMQLFFEKGTEFEDTNGLGLMPGTVECIPNKSTTKNHLILPHVGWNKIMSTENDRYIWEDKITDINQYFVHSYAAKFSKKIESNTICITNYGGHEFASIVRDKNTIGLQFHPERSGMDGINLLRNIIESLYKYK